MSGHQNRTVGGRVDRETPALHFIGELGLSFVIRASEIVQAKPKCEPARRD
jgi:hypothetical protein